MPDHQPAELTLSSRIPAAAAGLELLAFLVARFRYHDRERWQAELAAGRLQLDGRPAAGGERLRRGMRLVYHKHHVEPPVDGRWTLLYRDEDLLVVDKPAHLPVHADGPFLRHTLIALLRESTGDAGLQLAHRLDRETSGVCIAARTPAARAAVQQQFAAQAVRKEYVAVVRGRVTGNFVVDRAIGRAPGSAVRLRRSAAEGAEGARPARTSFELLAAHARHSLLRCLPLTGRTHQIRVHLEFAGHPVLGDRLYGRSDSDYLAFVARMKAGKDPRDVPAGEPGRQLLHAHRITIAHPRSGAPTTFTAPVPELFDVWSRS